MTPVRAPHAHLVRAKARLDQLGLYPESVQIERVRVVVWPGLFRLPFLRRFDGYATWHVIFMRRACQDRDDLLVHELCHVWQMQHHPVRVPLSYLRHGYHRNPFEHEARRSSIGELPLPAHDERKAPAPGADARHFDVV